MTYRLQDPGPPTPPWDDAIRSVLLVPEEGDPLGLLEDGPCGAVPPCAGQIERGDQTRNADGDPLRDWYDCENEWIQLENLHCPAVHPEALVLAWGGAPVAAGIDRVKRAVHRRMRYSRLRAVYQFADAVTLVRWACERGGLGAIIYLDGSGNEVAE